MIELPLFPLHTVLLPGIVLPLHVFEPRYRKMIRRCLDRDEPFGVVWIRDGREVGPGTVTLATVGTVAEIRSASRAPDGRYELLAAGTRRFALTEVDAEGAPYLVGQARELDEPLGDPDVAARLAWLALRRFARYLQVLEPGDGEVAEPIDVRIEVDIEAGSGAVAWAGAADDDDAFEVTAEAAEHDEAIDGLDDADADGQGANGQRTNGGGRGIVIPDDPAILSHLLAGIVQLEPARRQDLLEASSAEVRLAALVRLLGRELQLLGGRLRVFSAPGSIEPVRRN